MPKQQQACLPAHSARLLSLPRHARARAAPRLRLHGCWRGPPANAHGRPARAGVRLGAGPRRRRARTLRRARRLRRRQARTLTTLRRALRLRSTPRTLRRALRMRSTPRTLRRARRPRRRPVRTPGPHEAASARRWAAHPPLCARRRVASFPLKHSRRPARGAADRAASASTPRRELPGRLPAP